MSAQTAKKKKIGLRRQVVNQNNTSEVDDFHATDSTPVAQSQIPEENTESLNELANAENSQSESHRPPPPELTGNRRKLGSSRRSRGQRVKESATESYHDAREKVEEKMRGNETPETTQMSLAIQPVKQEELSKWSEDDMSATLGSSLYLATTPGFSSGVQSSTTRNDQEADLESLMPKNEKLQADQHDNATEYKVVSDSCKLDKTMLGGTDKSDTLKSEEVKENAHLVSIPELTRVSEQLIDQSNSREMSENVYSVAEKERKERNNDTELLSRGGNLIGNYVVSESHVESSVLPFSTTPEVTNDKSSPTEDTELEYSVEQAHFPSTKQEFPTDEEQEYMFSLSEVRGAQLSEDAINKVHKQEVNPTEIPQIDYSFESLIHDATEHFEIDSGNLIDQAKVSNAYQSEMIVKSTDDSAMKQEDSNFGKDDHPTKEINFEALDHRNEDYHDTKKPQISDEEREDTALGQVYEGEGQVEDDINPSAEQTVHQKKEGLFSEMEESKLSLQTLQSEINAPLDSQPQDNSVRIEEKTHTGFNPLENRRKMGSSRKSKGRHHVKDPLTESYHENNEEVERTSGTEALETTQMLLAIERTSQEELSQESQHDIIMTATHDRSLYSATMPGYSEVQKPTTTNYPETDLESLITKSKNLHEDHDERDTDFKAEMSDKWEGAALEGMNKSDTLQTQEVSGAHQLEDVDNKVREQEVKTTEMQETPQNDYSESVTHDATVNHEILSGNLIYQAEVSGQSELIVKTTDDSATKQEDSSPDDKHDDHPTKERNVGNEDYHDTKKPQISDVEREDTALGQVYEGEGQVEDDINPSAEQTVHQKKEGLFSEMEESKLSLQTLQSEINAPLDSQTQDNFVRIEEKTHTGFNPLENRRKMGSSRKSKGQHHVKDPLTESYHENNEEVERTSGTEALETIQMLLAIERTSQEELSQESQHDIIMTATHDRSLYSATMPGYSEVQKPTTTNYPETDLESLITKSKNLHEDHDERDTDFKAEMSDKWEGAALEGMNKSDTLQTQEVSGAHQLEDVDNKVREQEVKTTEMQETPQNDYSESVTHDATVNHEILSGNLIYQAEVSGQSELIVKTTDDSATKQEDSSPDDKHDDHPTKERNVGNEDYHDTKKPQISDVEREDTALGQVYEGEGQVEDDINPSAEQTVHQEKEGLFSEMEESQLSLQTLQSEINAPLDSQPQDNSVRIEEKTHTGFNPLENRRKMGSSRKNKGRHHVKDPLTESYHENNEEVERTSGTEALETTQMLLAIERTSQEELSQGSQHDVIMTATHDRSLYSATMPGYSEVQKPTTTNYPETDLESLITKSKNLHEDHDERDTDFKAEMSDKWEGAALEGMNKSDTLQTQEVSGAHQLEDVDNKVREQEVKTTEMQETPQNDYSESVTHDATVNHEILSGNLIYQAEVSGQSELIVKTTDDSATKQEDSSPDDKHDDHPTKERNVGNEDYHDTKKPQISDVEREDTALGQVYEGEGQVEDDINPSAEQTVHQEKEGLFSEMEESKLSLQTLQSEINAPLDSQPQDNSVRIEEKTHTGFNPLENRRKMGSSRKNKGRHHVKDPLTESYHENNKEVERTSGTEALETTQMLLAIERTSQEELSQESQHDIIMTATHDRSLYSATMPGYSEVQKPTTTNYPETDLESLITKSKNLHEDHDERDTDFKAEMSDKWEGAVLEGMNKSDTLQTQEVSGAHQLEDVDNKVREQEVKTTEMQETPQNDYSESVTHDATVNHEILSGNLIYQAEVSGQSELIVKTTDDSATKQEDSSPDDKHDDHPTKERNVGNEDYHDTKKPQISDVEREDTALGQVYEGEGQVEDDINPSAEQTVHQEKEGLFSEMEESKLSLQTLQSEINAPLDSQTQDNFVRIEEKTHTGFNPLENRRKMGSSRKNKGRHHVKDPLTESYHENNEEVEHTSGTEALETTQMLLAIERTSQEELSQGSQHDVIMTATHDRSLYSATMPGYSEVQKPTTTNYPETDLESLITKSKNLHEDHDERDTDFKAEMSDKWEGAALEGMNKSDTLQTQEVSGAHQLEDVDNKVREQEVKTTEMQETPQNDYSESVTHDATVNHEILSGNLIYQAEVSGQSELIVKTTDDSATKQEDSSPDDKHDDHPTKERNVGNEDYHDTKKPQISDVEREDTALGQVYEGEGQVEDDINPSAEQTVHQEKEGLFSEMEESKSFLQTLQSEVHPPLDSQSHQIDTGCFNPLGNSRKLGSSRRKKGRQHDKDSIAESYHRPTEEVIGNTRDNEPLETTNMSLTIETTAQETSRRKTMQEGEDTFDTARTEEDSDQVKENAHVGEHTEVKCSVEQEDFSSSREEQFTNEEQIEHESLSQVRRARHSEDVVNEVHEEEVKLKQMQEKPQMDYSSVNKSGSSLQTLQSEINAPLDSQPLDNSLGFKEQTHTDFKPTGNRRKLGSSRRNKGRQPISVTETYNEPKEEFEENTRGDEALETKKMSLETKTMRQEELKEQTDLDIKTSKEIRKIRLTVNDEEKTPGDDPILSQYVMDNSTFVKTDKDVNEEENHLIKEPENLSQLTQNDTVKMDSIQSPEVFVWKDDSDIRNISHHDDVPARSFVLDVVEQEAFQVQKTEALSYDKDTLGQEMNMQQNYEIETVGDVMIKDYNTETASSIDSIEVSEHGEVGEKFYPTKKDSETQEMNASQEITHSAHNKTDTLAPFDIGFEENLKAERTVDVSEEGGAVGARNSQQGIQETFNLDNSENLPGKSKQRRRKMGSTRQTHLNKKPEGGMDNKEKTKESNFIEADMKNLDNMEEVEELPMTVTAEVSQNENAKPSQSLLFEEQQEINETSTVHDMGQKLQSSASDLQSVQSNMISNKDDLKAVLYEQSASHNEEVVKFVQLTDVRDIERNVTSQLDQKLDSNTEDATNSGITGGSFVSLCETTQSTQNDEDQGMKSAEAPVAAVADFEILKSVVRGGAGEEHNNALVSIQDVNNLNEGAHDKNLEIKNASPNLNSTNRRRKMGSTRRNLGSRTKGEDLHQEQEVDNDVTETTTNVAEHSSDITDKDIQLNIEHKDRDSEQKKEVFETDTGESHFKPPAHQTFVENPVSRGQLVATEHQLPPGCLDAIPSTSPKLDVMSEFASGGRRRKMGSNRKSRGHQNNETQSTDRMTHSHKGADVRSITDESAVKTTEEESLGLDKISEADEINKKASSNISTTKAGERSRPVSEKTLERGTPVGHLSAEIHLGKESQKTFSLAGNSRGADLRSNRYNVMMVGDSSVGKTSFMKRAQSGKFSLDIPASVGLDSCVWTVVVEGKPMELQLWDTAGQERFHSITRQIFHKAQAFLLMYDITSSQSFSAVSYWASCIQEGAAENVTILLIGNKSDNARRQVKTQQGEILAKEYNFEFMECSAATGENVIQSLETVARMLSQKADTREEAMVLHKEPQQKKSGCC